MTLPITLLLAQEWSPERRKTKKEKQKLYVVRLPKGLGFGGVGVLIGLSDISGYLIYSQATSVHLLFGGVIHY